MPLLWYCELVPRTFTNAATVGCVYPVSSVQRDANSASLPSHFHVHRNRVCAIGSTGDCSSAGTHVVPPSTVTSTPVMRPRPDQATPVSSYTPGPGSLSPPDGR